MRQFKNSLPILGPMKRMLEKAGVSNPYEPIDAKTRRKKLLAYYAKKLRE
ncbi:hypothetical protein HZC09_02155 [Candidatus Micrarchaeota archaeon]|nr:hypothetical protein [Candidatus Micrarchaeota archaeon]